MYTAYSFTTKPANLRQQSIRHKVGLTQTPKYLTTSGYKAVETLRPGNSPSWRRYRSSRYNDDGVYTSAVRWDLHKLYAASTHAVYNSHAFYGASQIQVTTEKLAVSRLELPA